MCFAVPEKEVKAVAEALQSRFRQALTAGRLSQVLNLILMQPICVMFLICLRGHRLKSWVILSVI